MKIICNIQNTSCSDTAHKISIFLHQTGANSNELNIFATYLSSFSSSKWGLCRLDQQGHHSHTPPYSMNSPGDETPFVFSYQACFESFPVPYHPCGWAPAQCSVLLTGNFASIELFHCFQPCEKLTHKTGIICKQIRLRRIGIIDENVVFVFWIFVLQGEIWPQN